ncbi:PapB/FocB family fimbrial expression transcriptional regulator [Edwardsiella tarda]
MDICTINSNAMRQAIEDVLVNGKSRRDACNENKVSQSYFSVKYRHVRRVNSIVIKLHKKIVMKHS